MRCRKRGCLTRLSRWNPGPYCWTHAEAHWDKITRREQHNRNRVLAGAMPDDLTEDERRRYAAGDW